MAFGNLGGKSGDPGAQPGGSATATFIDAGCQLVGELKFSDDVRIDGSVEGSIEGAKTVTVGEAGRIDAGIKAESVIIHGNVDGDIRVQRKVTLHKSARVSGEIHTAGIVVEEGARFRGTIVIGDEPTAAEKPLPTGTAVGNPNNQS